MSAIPTTIAATLFIQIGYFLWKLSAQRQKKTASGSITKVLYAQLTDWRWSLGFLSTCLGWVLFVNATALGDISLIQPLMSAGDFILVLLAVIFLSEKLQPLEWVGLAIIIIGSAVLVWKPTFSETHTFNNNDLILFLTAVTLVLGCLLLVYFRRRTQSNASEIYLAFVVGLCFGAGSLLTKALTLSSNGFSWDVLRSPLMPATIVANTIGLISLQIAFRNGRAAIIIPVQLAVATGLTVLAGVLIFGEHLDGLRFGGIVLILAGTACLKLRT